MKKINLIFLVVLLSFAAIAQKGYFQQEVHYDIDVTLDDSLHTLTGSEQLVYVNHSPDILNEIYFHLWTNGYKDQTTAFAKQQVRIGRTSFYFSPPEKRGQYNEIEFFLKGEKLDWNYYKNNPDIAIVKLTKPLPPEGKAIINIKFTEKIPRFYSRLNHVKQQYNITQWYPKPAVYDREGWHPMPYLDMGEFYSEFGSFDVKITLPENYVVAATGSLQTEREEAFLEEKIKKTNTFLDSIENVGIDHLKKREDLPSAKKLKTIRYTAEDVHDFAWFANKRFLVQKSDVKLLSGKKIDTWVFFLPQFKPKTWAKATTYVNYAILHYSSLVGEYPYPQATAVAAASTGGGMEYPMITAISGTGSPRDLDMVITHEVGHNWFYGILGSNERDHPWMDEGMNSYYDHVYLTEHYGEAITMDLPKFLTKGSDTGLEELSYLFQARENLDQPPETSADDFSPINYFMGAYSKPAAILKLLNNYLGEKDFNQAMHAYFVQWKFKHPQPADFKSVLEHQTGKNLDWLFEGLLYSDKKVDYAIKDVKKDEHNSLVFTVKNNGEIAAPFPVTGVGGTDTTTQWYEGFTGEKELVFNNAEVTKLILDEKHLLPELRRSNNQIKTNGILKRMNPPRFKFLAGMENSQKFNINWAPLIGWNTYDGAMLGLGFYNLPLPKHRVSYALMPLYALGTKSLSGFGQIKLNLFPASNLIHGIELGISAKSFSFDYFEEHKYHTKYQRFVPFVRFSFAKKPTSEISQTVALRAIYLREEKGLYKKVDTVSVYIGKQYQPINLYELSYSLLNERAINPFGLRVNLEYQDYENISGKQNYLKTSVELNTSYTYNSGRSVDFRFFLGGFLKNTKKEGGNIFSGAFYLSGEGYSDYKYDGFFFGRMENEGSLSQQIVIKDGGFKNISGDAQRGVTGNTNRYMLAMNLVADLPEDLPFRLPVKPYFDVAYAQSAFRDKGELWWSGGFEFRFIKNTVSIYFPVISSKNLQSVANGRSGGKYLSKIAFTFDITKMNPWKAGKLIRKLN